MTRKRLLRIIIPGVLVVALGFGVLQHQAIYDWSRLRDYTPTASVSNLSKDVQLTALGQHIFYVAHPRVEPVESFRNDCRDAEQTIVLGCYKDDRDIFVREVTDNRLKGVQQVTAAHEMLHAAYTRLSGSEKKRVDAMIQQAFDSLKDTRIIATVKSYKDKDPFVVPNELHSIIGTEVPGLSKDLETYYSKYFSNRQAIVDFSNQYETEFTKRKVGVASYDTQLASLKTQITDLQTAMDIGLSAIQSAKASLDALLTDKDYSNYNAGVPGYNSKVNVYNSQIKQLQSKIDQYNSMVNSRNALAKELGDLVDSIDTRVPTKINQ